jgi:multidrug efflux pump subunit AcrB
MELLIGFFVRNRLAVGIFAFIIALMGLVSYITLPREAAPDLKIPVVLATVPYPGVSPADMETLVTNEIETELKDLKNVKVIRSTSAEGASIISVEFDPDVDIDDALRRVREKVDNAKPELPEDALEPVVQEISFEDFPILVVNMAGDYSLVRLKQEAEKLQDKLETIPGVLDVKLQGGIEREIQVLADPSRLAFHAVSIDELVRAVQGENVNLPGGMVEAGRSSYLVRVPGEYKSAAEIEDVVIKSRSTQKGPEGTHTALRVSEVARVIDTYKERSTLGRINGGASVSLQISKRGGANLIKLNDDVKAMVQENISKMPPGTRVTFLQDQSKFVRDIVSDLQNNIMTGLLLVLAVLPFFLTVRSSIIVASAIPLSMLMSLAVIDFMGMTLNMVVLFSLILALGMLVDNSIVVVENTYRLLSTGMPRWKAAVLGAKEVAWPVIASTATTVAAFAPLLFWPGIMGKFMGFLPKTLIITLLSSLFVALVVNPVMCSLLLQVNERHEVSETSEPTGRIYKQYRRTLAFAVDRWYLTFAVTLAALVFTIGVFGSMGLGVEFFPDTTPDTVIIEARTADGTRLEATDEVIRNVETALDREGAHIKNFVTVVGAGGGNPMQGGGGGAAPHLASLTVDFIDAGKRTESSLVTIEKIRAYLDAIPGAEFEVRKQDMGPPAGAPVGIELTGENWDTLGKLTKEMTEAIKPIPGLVDLKDDFNLGRPEVQVRVDRERAKLVGAGTFQVASALRTAINGTKATTLREGADEYDVTVRFEETSRKSLEDLESLIVTGRDGKQVPLREVATIVTTTGAGSIRHKDRERVITFSANAEGRLPNEVREDVQKVLEQLELPAGYAWRMAGENVEQEEAQAFLGRAFGIAFLSILLIIVMQFNSLSTPLIIMTSVLLSTVGVLWGLIIFQRPFGVIMTGLGIISLAGVAVNNAIVLIDFIRQRQLASEDKREALITAGVIRLRPVLLTAITTVLGLTPMVFGVNIDFVNGAVSVGGKSAEMWSNMAIAVVHGLIFTTFLTLILVPSLVHVTNRFTGWVSGLLTRLFGGGEPRRGAAARSDGSSVAAVADDDDAGGGFG